MRILIVDTAYPGFLAEHYMRRPELARESYDVQWRVLMERFFGTADAYSYYLGELGHSAREVVINCRPLQERWADEHGIRRWSARQRFTLVLAQADEYEADIVYVQDLNALPSWTLGRLKRRGRLLVGQIASEPPPLRRLRRFDLLCTSLPHYVERFRALGISTEYLRIGFDPRVLPRLGDRINEDGAVFVGSLGRRQHEIGNRVLERAACRVPIAFWGRGADEWPRDSAIRRFYRGEAWGLDMLQVLARARISLNRHIDVADGNANNMRLYEATGVGSLLLTDEKKNLGELFRPDEVVTYRDEDELVEKIAWYLEHEDERVTIASAGQQRTLRDHTYAIRMQELAAILGHAPGIL